MPAFWRKAIKAENGFSLIEACLSLALLGIIGVAFLSGLGTVSRLTIIIDERQTAKNLAETQMEYVNGQGYASAYVPDTIPPEYGAYSAAVAVEPMEDSNIQKITVTIWHQSKAVTSLVGYKVR